MGLLCERLHHFSPELGKSLRKGILLR